jgi:aromatic ring hydroxylase
MGLRTPTQYVDSLRDGRTVFFRGQRVADVTTHPVIGIAVDHAAIDFRMAEDPRYRGLAVIEDRGEAYSRYYHLPRNADDLLKRSALIAASTREGATLVVLIKEIGSDALFALHIVGAKLAAAGKPEYRERIAKYHRYCRENDLAVAVAQTDAKGDRSLAPAAQEHPDYYLRIVEELPNGIVVRGAKVHTSVSTNTNEVIVLPTRAMKPEDGRYAVAFALPVATPGLKLIASPHGSSPKDPFEHPISARHKMIETLTVFDDVFVPKERVFLQGEAEFAGLLGLTFVRFHRFTAVSYKLPLLELLTGAGYAIAEANGVLGAGHVRDKLTHLAAYHTIVRGLIEHAAGACSIEEGVAVPDTLLTNVAKYHFAHNYHQAVQTVQDLAGGLLVTAPATEDLTSEATGEFVRRYLGG